MAKLDLSKYSKKEAYAIEGAIIMGETDYDNGKVNNEFSSREEAGYMYGSSYAESIGLTVYDVKEIK